MKYIKFFSFLIPLYLGVEQSASMDFGETPTESRTYSSYLKGIETQNVYEKTFEPLGSFNPLSANPFEKEIYTDNVPSIGRLSICYDTSNSTKFNTKDYTHILSELLSDEKLAPYIDKDGYLDISEFKDAVWEKYDGEIDGEQADTMIRNCPISADGKVCLGKKGEIDVKLATKHISLALLEAIDCALEILVEFPRIEYPLEFCFVNFSTDAKKALFSNFPYIVGSATALLEISKDLPNKVPYPHPGGTVLSTALEEIEKVKSTKHNDQLLIIATDGQTMDYDKSQTLKLLNSIRNKTEEQGGRLLIFTIGAGSVLNNQCDIKYLESLLSCASKGDNDKPYGVYAGAYKRYEDLKSKFIDFIKQTYDYKAYGNAKPVKK